MSRAAAKPPQIDLLEAYSQFMRDVKQRGGTTKELYDHIHNHGMKKFEITQNKQIKALQCCAQAYSLLANPELYKLFASLPPYLGRERTLKICSPASGYSFELLAVDYILSKLGIKNYEYTGIDKDGDDIEICKRVYKSFPARFISADASDYDKLMTAFSKEKLDTTLGYDVFLNLHFNLGGFQAFQDDFRRIIEHVVPRLANPRAVVYSSTYILGEMQNALLSMSIGMHHKQYRFSVYDECTAVFNATVKKPPLLKMIYPSPAFKQWFKSVKSAALPVSFPIVTTFHPEDGFSFQTPFTYQFTSGMAGLCHCPNALVTQPRHEILKEVGARLYKAGHFREAIDCFQQRLENKDLTDDLKARLHYNLARSYAGLKQYDSALHHFYDAEQKASKNNTKLHYQACIVECHGLQAYAKQQPQLAVAILNEAVALLTACGKDSDHRLAPARNILGLFTEAGADAPDADVGQAVYASK
jgi:tetratricopeptide (TPR) repeat protein